jgi:hypothetical protein
MAKSLDQYQKDKNAAEAKIRGSKTELERVTRELQLYDIGSKEYNKAKKRAKELNAAIKTYKKELEVATKELTDYAENKKAEKTKTKSEQEAARAEEQAQRAQDAGDTAAAAKIRADAAAAKAKIDADAKAKADAAAAAKAKGALTGSQFQVSDSALVGNELAKADVTFDGSGRPIVQYNFTDKDGKQSVDNAYLYVTTTAGGTGEKAFFFGTIDVVRDRYQKQLIKNYGSKQAVIDKLYKAGYLSTNKEVPTDAYLTALDAASAAYTVAQVNAYKIEGLKEFATMDEFLAAKKGTGLGGTKTRKDVIEFGETDATMLINTIYQRAMGRDANSKELGKLIPLINQQLKKNPDLVSTTTDAKGNVVATKKKTGLNVEQFLIEEVSGKDEAKAKQVLDYYNVFKQTLGVS